MKKLFFLLFLFSIPAYSKTTTCTQALVNGNLCASTQGVLISYFVPNGSALKLRDALADEANYQDTVPCKEVQEFDQLGILQSAGLGDPGCTVVGTEVTNPQGKGPVADRWLLNTLIELVLKHQERIINEAAEEEKSLIPKEPITE